MRTLVSLVVVLLVGCSSAEGQADESNGKDKPKPIATRDHAPAHKAKKAAKPPVRVAERNTAVRKRERKTERPAPMIPPTGKLLTKHPDVLRNIQRNKWFAFSNNYFRMWGGRMIGSHPKGISVTYDGKVFVTNVGFTRSRNVDRFDIPHLKIIARAHFRGGAIESATSPDGKTIYATNFHRHVVTALDTKKLRVKREYKVGTMPKGVAVSNDGSRLYVSNWESGDMHVVAEKTGKIIKHIKLGRHPRGIVLLHDESKVYVTNFGSNNVSVVDVKKLAVVKTIAQGCGAARHAAVTKNDRLLLVTCYHSHHVVVIDTKTDKVVRKVKVGNGPKTIAISQDQRFAYTANYRGSSMSIINMKTWKSITVPLPVWKTSGLAVSPDDKWIYLTGFDSRNLIVMQRLAPGQDPEKMKRGPSQPKKKCRREKLSYCTSRYP